MQQHKKLLHIEKKIGKFKSIEENVSGIGEAKFEKIKEKICI